MDEKPPPSRRSSGHSEKAKKSNKKKKKSKYKERKRGKSSPDETNSDSALETGRKRISTDKNHSSQSTAKSCSSGSVDARKSKSNTSSGSGVRSHEEFLQKCIVDIFDSHRQAPKSSRAASKSNSRASANSQESSDLDNDLDDVSEALNESLRWDNPCSNPKDEEERIRIYKINRRKRYLIESVKHRHDKEGVLRFARELAAADTR
ncbi:uncharacterized protein [Diadema antillarum]|uniref:uncharacterized protein n=1 Tax=Diadema antillarum TaxID=105358 RepID=UPI003A88F74C